MSRGHAPVWVVSVGYEDADTIDYGPYTELQAERVAARIKDEVELSSAHHPYANLHPFGILHAIAMPLGRYESEVGFLTGADRRALRTQVRAHEREGYDDHDD